MVTRSVKNEDELTLLADRFYPVLGYEGLYEISIDGRVRSLPRRVRSRGGTRIFPSRLRVVQIVNGYPAFNARKDGRSRYVSIHRALALLFLPNPEGKPDINHIDGNKTNFDLANLEWCTHAENMRHAFDTGLVATPTSGPGNKSPAARLSWDDVREIRTLAANGEPRSAIAAKFGVCKSNINQIIRGETWRVEQ